MDISSPIVGFDINKLQSNLLNLKSSETDFKLNVPVFQIKRRQLLNNIKYTVRVNCLWTNVSILYKKK